MGYNKTKEFQQKIAEEFINALYEDGLSWKRGWDMSGAPQNGATNHIYKGINALWLSLIQRNEKFDDPRWFTFVQIADKNNIYHKDQKWKLKKGSHGYTVEYAMPVKKGKLGIAGKAISWEEYRKESEKEDFNPNDYFIGKKYTTVFNGNQIEGLEPFEVDKSKVHSLDSLVTDISKGLKVDIRYDGGGRAFYSDKDDCVHLPPKSAFQDETELNSTALHELAHSTGAEHRLNRETLKLYSRDISYRAKEELIAEITSAMMSCHIKETLTDIDNHKAYIKSWCEAINNDPKFLVEAIKESEKTTEYLETKGGITQEKDKQQNKEKILNKNNTTKNKSAIDRAKSVSQISTSKNYNINKDYR